MKLASVFFGFNGHAARLTLPRASATSRPPLPAKCHGMLRANLVLEPCASVAGRLGRAIASDNEHFSPFNRALSGRLTAPERSLDIRAIVIGDGNR
jgi:hypothetical protein